MNGISKILGTNTPCQIGMICNDVETTKRMYAKLWNVEVPPTCDGGPYEITGCEYMGEPAPTNGCKMAFFQLGNIEYEIIEPYGGPSTWKDFLDATGGGIHHVAFQVKDIDETIEKCLDFGLKLTQKGKYCDASGAYAYFDARKDLGCFLELLCTFERK